VFHSATLHFLWTGRPNAILAIGRHTFTFTDLIFCRLSPYFFVNNKINLEVIKEIYETFYGLAGYSPRR